MKRIAIFVEGQTEQVFVKKLLEEIAGHKKIAIELKKFAGKAGTPTVQIIHSHPAQQPQHGALIYDCGGDEGVKSRILEESPSLFAQQYQEIIGIRDLYPLNLSDLPRLRQRLASGHPPLPPNAHIVVAVHEVEAWFLAETTHYARLSPRLEQSAVLERLPELGFDPWRDDMRLRPHPAGDLHALYQLGGKGYTKKKRNVERTVDCLDYAHLYLDVRTRIEELGALITRIDAFLT